YRRRILAPMFEALDALPDTGAVRHEFFNARGAVFKFSRRSMEVRILDTQECVKLDVAIAIFVRAALKSVARSLRVGPRPLPAHAILVDDFRATVARGSEARVWAPHLEGGASRDDTGQASVREVQRLLLERECREVRKGEVECRHRTVRLYVFVPPSGLLRDYTPHR